MLKAVVLSALIIAFSIAFLCIKLIFRKDGKFSSIHIHDSEPMRQRGIHCVIDQDREQRQKQQSFNNQHITQENNEL